MLKLNFIQEMFLLNYTTQKEKISKVIEKKKKSYCNHKSVVNLQ